MSNMPVSRRSWRSWHTWSWSSASSSWSFGSKHASANDQDSPHESIQVMSDLHLEFAKAYETFDIPQKAPYLLLGGGVGRLQDYNQYCMFLQRQCAKFERVFLVLGNYEFHGITRTEGNELLRQLCSEPVLNERLTILHRTRHDINDHITILGCTLQSRISERVMQQVQRRQHVRVKAIARNKIQQQTSEHEKDVAWLKHELEVLDQEPNQRMVIIATHFPPSFKTPAKTEFANSMWKPDFSSNVFLGEAKDWHGLNQVGFWVFGHTHWNVHKRIGKYLEIVSNQRGYVQFRQRYEKTIYAPESPEPPPRRPSLKERWRLFRGRSSSPSSMWSTKSADVAFNLTKVLDLSDGVRRLDKLLE